MAQPSISDPPKQAKRGRASRIPPRIRRRLGSRHDGNRPPPSSRGKKHQNHEGGRSWDFNDPYSQLHLTVYGMPRVTGAADSIMNMQHGGEVRAEWVSFPDDNGRQSIYLLVIEQARHCEATPNNPEGWTLQVPHGNTDLGHPTDGTREFTEEVGIAIYDTESDVIQLKDSTVDPFCARAIGANANNGWIVHYPSFEAAQQGEIRPAGATYSARRVPTKLVERVPDTPFLRFKAGVLGPRTSSVADADNSLKEQIGNAFFIPVVEALRSRDTYTSQAAARLMAHLYETGSLDPSIRS